MGQICNVKERNIGNIRFRSSLERDVYLALTSLKLNFSYESEKFVLQHSFKHLGQTCRAITYTPDFVVNWLPGYKVYIECKGHKTEVYRIKKKMFFLYLKQYEPQNFCFEAYKVSDVIDFFNSKRKKKWITS